jgi:hypothetical protein
MKLKFPAVLVMVIILLVFLAACGMTAQSSAAVAAATVPDDRFTIIFCEKETGLTYCRIILDNETGVKYLYCSAGYGAGLCKLEAGQ